MKRSLLVVPCLMLTAGCSSAREETEPKPVVTVKLATAELMDVRSSVRAPALVHPRQQANIASRLTAVIQELSAWKGSRVEAGVVLAKLDDRDLQAQRAEALATLRQAEVLAERRTRLFEEGAIPQRELLATQTELLQSKARLELIDTQLKFSELRSPFAGRLTEQFMYPGDMAKPDAPVFTIMDIEVAVARGQVPEAESAPIRPGQLCAFAPTDQPEKSFEGRITVLPRAVDPGRRTVEAWCEIANYGGRLLPGAFGELRIFTGSAPQSVVVPLPAVEFAEGTKRGSVVVVDGQGLAHRREVLGGEILLGKVQILEGLKAGDQVVVEGGYGLPEGTAVRFAEKGEQEEKAGKPAKPGKQEK